MPWTRLLRGFYSDNDSEFVNYTVAQLLNKLLIRFTKSRPRHSDDNGLVESKNGSVVRKQLGYAYIPQSCAERVNGFNRGFFNLYINFHRPCFFPVSVIDPKGKIKKVYPFSFNKSQCLLMLTGLPETLLFRLILQLE